MTIKRFFNALVDARAADLRYTRISSQCPTHK